jgi:purine-nucleoside phosphorylase
LGKIKELKGAIKLHTLLDYDRILPASANITNCIIFNKLEAYDVPFHKGSVMVADQFYNNFSLLNVWDSNGVFFIVRHKDNL